MSSPIYGTVDNGVAATVSFPFYSGRVGLRADEGGGEFSCPSPRSTFLRAVTGTVDNKAAVVTAVRKSATSAGMIVATFTFKPTEEPIA